MKTFATLLARAYRIYNTHVGILMPVVGVTLFCVFFIHRIPYINLYAQEALTAILIVDWGLLVVLSRLKLVTQLKATLVLVAAAFVLRYLGRDLWADTIMNVMYLILVWVCVSYLRKK